MTKESKSPESKSPQIPQLPEAPQLTRARRHGEETSELTGTPQLTGTSHLVEVLQPELVEQSEVVQRIALFFRNLARQYNNSLKQHCISLNLLTAASVEKLRIEADQEDREDIIRVERLRRPYAPIQEEENNANPQITRAQATNLQEMNSQRSQQRERR